MKLIDKDALVAEIEKLDNQDFSVIDDLSGRTAYLQAIGDFYRILDTLGVKEAVLLTPEEIKKICTIYDNLKQERECATVLYNSDEMFFNHVLMEYKSIAQKGE